MTPEELLQRLRTARSVVVLAGAGISTAAGIPDFRSASGVYALLEAGGGGCAFQRYWRSHLTEPQEVFDGRVFAQEPRIFYSIAGALYESFATAQPSLCHRFLAALGPGLRSVLTQNVDGLEGDAGVEGNKLIQLHGHLRDAVCSACGHAVHIGDAAGVQGAILGQGVTLPHCEATAGPCARRAPRPLLPPGAEEENDERSLTQYKGVYKPAVVFFHEPLPSGAMERAAADVAAADLVLVLGSSMRVHPVAALPSLVPPDVPCVIINGEALPHVRSDLTLEGDIDSIVAVLWAELGKQAGWRPMPGVREDGGEGGPVPAAATCFARLSGCVYRYTGPCFRILPLPPSDSGDGGKLRAFGQRLLQEAARRAVEGPQLNQPAVTTSRSGRHLQAPTR
jgi:NAD-dependent histone deacetylase SIR2